MPKSEPPVPDDSWVEVPPSALSPEALIGVVDEFVTREGTDYGEREYTLLEKRAQLMRLLERGEVILVYDPKSGSTTLLSNVRTTTQK